MPANLTPQYREAELRFKAAHTTPEKIAALEEMLATIPKHKGTEKMQAELKRRLSKLRGEPQKKGGPTHAAPSYLVEREGAGQVALVGPPNSGKSSLVARLTHARPQVADYPFTTRLPLPGMMECENIQIQLVDLPPLHPDFPEPWLPQLIRNADAMVVVVDASEAAVLERVTDTLALLDHNKIAAGAAPDPLPRGFVRKPALLVATKCDRAGAGESIRILMDRWRERFPFLAVSAQTGENLEGFRLAVFELLAIVRVYSKVPGKKPDRSAPFVLPRGTTVQQLAVRVHKDIAARLRFARVWGAGKFEGQMVQRDYVLADNDTIELHT